MMCGDLTHPCPTCGSPTQMFAPREDSASQVQVLHALEAQVCYIDAESQTRHVGAAQGSNYYN